jgi:hypothetical protein
MHRAYLDTEFTSLNRYNARLISLALVVPDGREFYVELIDAWKDGDCSDFVKEIVLPQLDEKAHGHTTELARKKLQTFLRAISPVAIISDAVSWDWPFLLWLAGPEGLPDGVTVREIPEEVEVTLEFEDPPHHALLDARLLASLLK